MNPKAKLLFDECIGHPVVESLIGLAGFSLNEVEVAHLIALGWGGVRDDEWIPLLAQEHWLIITGDRGKQGSGSKGAKLPAVCQQLGVSYAVMSKSIHGMKSFDKARAILNVWDALIDASKQNDGCGYAIRPHGGSGTSLIKVYTPEPKPEPKPATQKLMDLGD